MIGRVEVRSGSDGVEQGCVFIYEKLSTASLMSSSAVQSRSCLPVCIMSCLPFWVLLAKKPAWKVTWPELKCNIFPMLSNKRPNFETKDSPTPEKINTWRSLFWLVDGRHWPPLKVVALLAVLGLNLERVDPELLDLAETFVCWFYWTAQILLLQ